MGEQIKPDRNVVLIHAPSPCFLSVTNGPVAAPAWRFPVFAPVMVSAEAH